MTTLCIEIDSALDTVHAVLWAHDAPATFEAASLLRERIIERARDSYAIARAAETQAEREYDTRGAS